MHVHAIYLLFLYSNLTYAMATYVKHIYLEKNFTLQLQAQMYTQIHTQTRTYIHTYTHTHIINSLMDIFNNKNL